jgi:AcrR family transcriptional regulator
MRQFSSDVYRLSAVGAAAVSSQRTPPRSRRGMRTRTPLVEAARRVFERDDLDALIADISKEAGVSAGSFYTYLDRKEEVFAAVVEAVQEDLVYPHRRKDLRDDVRVLIDPASRDYLFWRRSAAFVEQNLRGSARPSIPRSPSCRQHDGDRHPRTRFRRLYRSPRPLDTKACNASHSAGGERHESNPIYAQGKFVFSI